MSNERHVFFCGGAKPEMESAARGIELNIHKNIRFEIGQFLERLVTNFPDHVMDLMDIAAYVYVADQMTSRGVAFFVSMARTGDEHLTFILPSEI